MMLFRELFDNETQEIAFLTKCLEHTNNAVCFPKTSDDIEIYTQILMQKYGNKILSDYVEMKYKDAPSFTSFKDKIGAMIDVSVAYDNNKIIVAWGTSYNALEDVENEDYSGYAYNSVVAQPTSSRVKTSQKANKQQAILDEIELRKKSIIDYILYSIIDKITLKIY